MPEPSIDRPVINRRRALTLLGAAGVGTVVFGACGGSDDPAADRPAGGTAGATPTTSTGSSSLTPLDALGANDFVGAASCTLTPEQTLGPYYIDVDSIRADIREDRQGAPLRVGVRVLDVDGCTPVRDALVELWHADADGLYSGFEAASMGRGGGGSGPGGGARVTDENRYLRGGQVTNGDGIAEMLTVYPGWYQGRTVHIHAKVQLSNRDLLTTQLYFDDALTDEVFTSAPYGDRETRTTRNDDDGIYRSETTMTVSKTTDGYLGLITIGVRA